MKNELYKKRTQALDLAYHPDPVLRKVSSPLDLARLNDKDFQQFLANMILTMRKHSGAGLAAPQVFVNKRVIVIAPDEKSEIIMINPKITKKTWARQVEEEGCLSILGSDGELVFGPVSRHKLLTCSYIDISGKKKKLEANEYVSRIIQHEIDHLDGILFIDKLEKGASLKSKRSRDSGALA